MYTPSSFKEENPKALFDLIEDFSFGILFSQHYEQPEATHLPFLVDRQRGDHGVLVAHFAKANKHWKKLIEPKEVLAVFQGPHSYISPSWYEDRAEVPTWNYATVHTYGIPRIIHDSSELRDMVTRLTHHHEDEINSDWSIDEVSKQDFETDLKAIVGLEIEITRMEGKFKFNQNKSDEDQSKVIKNLDERNRNEDRNEVSDIMKKNLSSNKGKS